MKRRKIAYIDIKKYILDTQELTTIETGAYFILLMLQWKNGNKINQNDFDYELSKICGSDKKAMIYVAEKYFIFENGEYRLMDQFKDVIK